MSTTTTETDLLVTELVLIEKGYDDVPKKVDKAMREVDASHKRGTDSARKVVQELSSPEVHGGFQKVAEEAKRTFDTIATARQRMASSGSSGSVNQGGRKVATVGHLNWLMPETPMPEDIGGGLSAWFKKNQNTPLSFNALTKDLSAALSKVRPNIDWSAAKKGASDFADHIKGGFSDAVSALNPLKAIGVGVAAFAAAGAATGFKLMEVSADFDSLKQSLYAVEGSRKAGDKALADLKNLAKAPGLGFEQAVSAYTGLRNAGEDEDFVKRAIREFANANAQGGGSADTFGRIMYQLKQSAGRDYLAQEDLGAISEAGVPINSLLKKKYGTGDTEELKAKGITAKQAIHDLVDELAKMPRVAGGFKNELDNLSDAIKFAEVSAGDALNQAFLPMASEMADAFSALTENGEIKTAFDEVAANIRAIIDPEQEGMEGVLRSLLVAIEDLSAGARNLAENSKGFWETVNDWHTWAFRPLGGKAQEDFDKKLNGDGDEFDDSLAGEHERNADMHRRQSIVQKERDAWRKAQKGGYKGKFNDWDKLSAADQKKWLDEADKQKAAVAAPATETKPAPNSPAERTARAVEQLVVYKKRQMDIIAASAGGGELTRLGVGATELSGHTTTGRERLLQQAVRLIAEYSAIRTIDRQVSDARHASRTY